MQTLAFELVPHAPTPMQRMNSHLGADNILETLAGKQGSPPGSPVSSQDLGREASEERRQEADLKAMPTLEHVMDNRIEAPVDAEAYDLHKGDIEEFQYAPLSSFVFEQALFDSQYCPQPVRITV